MNKEKLEHLRYISSQIESLEKEIRFIKKRKIEVHIEDYGEISLSAIELIRKIALADLDDRLTKLKYEFQEG